MLTSPDKQVSLILLYKGLINVARTVDRLGIKVNEYRYFQRAGIAHW
jgi:hypothetical protein